MIVEVDRMQWTQQQGYEAALLHLTPDVGTSHMLVAKGCYIQQIGMLNCGKVLFNANYEIEFVSVCCGLFFVLAICV